jgi:heme/copper-type cytochrome/quinol oxidase subunit 2
VPVSRHLRGSTSRFILVVAVLAAIVSASAAAVVQSRRDFTVVAKRYAFTVSGNTAAEIRVTQDDLVHVTLSTDDIPHSFTIEEPPYRIMRRVEAGKPVSFDFRADQPGRFRFFCNLTADSGCRQMHGTLIVDSRR